MCINIETAFTVCDALKRTFISEERSLMRVFPSRIRLSWSG